ncbi:hypothetical protein HYDPIDRAFT_115552 [Hydnomerulius pinastri MD-312]|uniref:Uncharacterized protein n=1 Tax=Hydnomerulius pinastri MD-312 TaxID=994086 RepID=A0A0C9V7W9_9AGAM|nr:hypothetical protein HYDPIDRAFT_115552 [Hydnomerulius pinastri MD-312]
MPPLRKGTSRSPKTALFLSTEAPSYRSGRRRGPSRCVARWQPRYPCSNRELARTESYAQHKNVLFYNHAASAPGTRATTVLRACTCGTYHLLRSLTPEEDSKAELDGGAADAGGAVADATLLRVRVQVLRWNCDSNAGLASQSTVDEVSKSFDLFPVQLE